MQDTKNRLLLERLKDERSRRVIFVSYYLLNANTRYLGGAFRPGGVNEVIDFLQRESVGICQMHCPEQRVWGGVLKRHPLRIYGTKGTLLHCLRRIVLLLFLWYTPWRYLRLAKEVIDDREDYLWAGFEMAGIVGVGGSPSCGVWTRLDLERSFEILAQCPLAKFDRQTMNEEAIAARLQKGEGVFTAAIQQLLRRKHIIIPFYEFALFAEMRGEPFHLIGKNGRALDSL